MDATEKRLYDAYNNAVDRLKKIPKGDPRHMAANRAVVRAWRELQKYQQRDRN